MNVPLLNLQAQYVSLRDDVRDIVDKVFDSQHFVLGAHGRALEGAIADYSQTKHAIGCASGSDALLLALMALDIGQGDEVITTPFTFFATGAAIARLGAKPVFVDIDPNSYNIDAAKIPSAITSHTKAILPVHLYGQCAEWIRCWRSVGVAESNYRRCRPGNWCGRPWSARRFDGPCRNA